MRISELIEILELIKQQEGDVEIEAYDDMGEKGVPIVGTFMRSEETGDSECYVIERDPFVDQ